MTISILHLITGLRVGGAEHMLEKLVTGMDRTAFDNTVVSLTTEGQVGRRLREAGIPVYALGIADAASVPLAVLRLRGLLRRQRPAITQTWLYHADLVGSAAYLAAFTPGRLVWNLRCSDMNMADYSTATRWVLRLLGPLSRLPDTIVTNSEAGRRHHVALGYRAAGWHTIPNGFDLAAFRPDADAHAALRRDLGIPADAAMAGMVARVDPMKDHGNFLAMARRLAPARPDLHFVLVGRGCTAANPLLAAALADLGGRLHLLGEREDVRRLMPGFDVLVLTSAYGEGFPNVLGEALACGLPCVATDVGDAAAILGGEGRIVPPRDAAALADAVAAVLALPSAERAAWRARIRARAETHFALPDVIRRYETFYRALAAGRQASGPVAESPPVEDAEKR